MLAVFAIVVPPGWMGPDEARLRGSRPGDRFRSSNILAAMKRGIDCSAPIGDEVRATTCLPSG